MLLAETTSRRRISIRVDVHVKIRISIFEFWPRVRGGYTEIKMFFQHIFTSNHWQISIIKRSLRDDGCEGKSRMNSIRKSVCTSSGGNSWRRSYQVGEGGKIASLRVDIEMCRYDGWVAPFEQTPAAPRHRTTCREPNHFPSVLETPKDQIVVHANYTPSISCTPRRHRNQQRTRDEARTGSRTRFQQKVVLLRQKNFDLRRGLATLTPRSF